MPKNPIKLDGQIIGTEAYDDFPMPDGKSPIVISHSVEILKQFRGQGFGQKAHADRLDRWARNGYNYAMCVVRRDNDPQLHILRKNGWVRLANTATLWADPVYIMGRSLK